MAHAAKDAKKTARPRKSGPRIPRLTRQRLNELVEEATIDAYGESEQAMGLYTMIEDNLCLPFETEVLGVPVTVVAVDLNDRDEIVAVCKRGDKKPRIDLLNLPLPTPPPVGAEWIEAYRHWRCGSE